MFLDMLAGPNVSWQWHPILRHAIGDMEDYSPGLADSCSAHHHSDSGRTANRRCYRMLPPFLSGQHLHLISNTVQATPTVVLGITSTPRALSKAIR